MLTAIGETAGSWRIGGRGATAACFKGSFENTIGCIIGHTETRGGQPIQQLHGLQIASGQQRPQSIGDRVAGGKHHSPGEGLTIAGHN